eukprot:103956_1
MNAGRVNVSLEELWQLGRPSRFLTNAQNLARLAEARARGFHVTAAGVVTVAPLRDDIREQAGNAQQNIANETRSREEVDQRQNTDITSLRTDLADLATSQNLVDLRTILHGRTLREQQ